MKTLIIILLSFNTLAQDSFRFTADKQQHFALSFAITSGVSLVAASDGDEFINLKRGMITGAATSLSAGLFKEIAIDGILRKTRISGHDLVYDLAGTIVGSAVAYGLIKWGLNHTKKKAKL